MQHNKKVQGYRYFDMALLIMHFYQKHLSLFKINTVLENKKNKHFPKILFRITFQLESLLRTLSIFMQSKNQPQCRGEYNVYSTFQSHEPEFDYLKSLEIEEKINKIRWLPQKNAAQFLLSTNG